ncbi:bacillithiol biosynthesis BshC [bacterium]|nr:bacillithiol biosynthesis BshC [bacterium]
MQNFISKYLGCDQASLEIMGTNPYDKKIRKASALTQNSNTVVTGQQTGLFLGPVFLLYKIASAIAVAHALSQETGRTIRPLLWVQSEDHDFDEIRSVKVLNQQNQVVTLELAQRLGQPSVKYQVLGDEVTELIDALAANISHLPHAQFALELIQRHYLAGNSIADAFSSTLKDLYQDQALDFFDPRDFSNREIKTSIAAIYSDAFSYSEEFSHLALMQAEAMRGVGLEPQVRIRSGSPLFFIHPEGVAGNRYRVERAGSNYRFLGNNKLKKISQSELAEFIRNSPEQVSASALLRPLIQDTILKPACYIAGPSELIYLAQITPLYQKLALQRSMPVLRNSFYCPEIKGFEAESQERELAAIYFLAKYGKSFLERILSLSNPFETELKIKNL